LKQAENLMNKNDFKEFFQKTLKDLNFSSLKLINKRNSEEGFKSIADRFQNNLQKMLQKADETLKEGNIKEALQIYDLGFFLEKFF